MELALQEVWVESVFGRELKVYAKTGELMLTLPLVLSRQTQRPTHPEHEILNEAYREKRKQKQGAVVEKFKAAFGSVGEAYLEGLHQKEFLWSSLIEQNPPKDEGVTVEGANLLKP